MGCRKRRNRSAEKSAETGGHRTFALLHNSLFVELVFLMNYSLANKYLGKVELNQV
jgi:hypothetical protein